MHRIKFNKARLFLIFSLILFISAGFLYSQTSTNAEVSFTNLPNSKRLASKIYYNLKKYKKVPKFRYF